MKLSKFIKSAVVATTLCAPVAVLIAPVGDAQIPLTATTAQITRTATCTGTLDRPGILSGDYWFNVVVAGVCFVDGGSTTVYGNLTLMPGTDLVANFGLDDVTGTGTTSLTVMGNLSVGSGALLLLGCEPNESPCTDDPNAASGGTLTGQNHVVGNLVATDALAVVVHATVIDGSVLQTGGGGGANCTPPVGLFASEQTPAFSDYEDSTIGGDLEVSGLQTCWFGALRDEVHGSLTEDNDTMADPDAGEILQNVVSGNMECSGDSPAAQYGDSGASPNLVAGLATGQCGFGVTSFDSAYDGGANKPITLPSSGAS